MFEPASKRKQKVRHCCQEDGFRLQMNNVVSSLYNTIDLVVLGLHVHVHCVSFVLFLPVVALPLLVGRINVFIL